MPWFGILLSARIALIFVALALALMSYFSKRRGLLVGYFVFASCVQAVLASLEEPAKIEYYQYISYFYFMSALAFQGTLREYFFFVFPFQLLTHLVPLYFKEARYFESAGTFVFEFTTPVAMTFLSGAILWINSSKWHLLIEKNRLMTRLLELEKNVRSEVESQLSEAKAMLVSATRAQAFSSVALQVAHDIRSPLAALDLIQKEFLKEEKNDVKVDWGLIRALLPLATSRVKSIAENVLKASKTCVASEVDLRKALEDLILEKQVEHAEKRVKIELRTLGNPGLVTLMRLQDADGLIRTCSNLLNNAVEASQESHPESSSTVEVCLSLGRTSALIEILDSGPGLSTQLRYALETGDFEKVTSSKADGHGIGLRTAYEWASQNGGRLLAVLPEAGQGTLLKLEVARLS